MSSLKRNQGRVRLSTRIEDEGDDLASVSAPFYLSPDGSKLVVTTTNAVVTNDAITGKEICLPQKTNLRPLQRIEYIVASYRPFDAAQHHVALFEFKSLASKLCPNFK